MLSIEFNVISKPQPIEVGKYILKGLKKGMLHVEADVKKSFGKGNTPKVRTGKLRQSITSKAYKKGNDYVGVVGSNIVYARIQELGGTIKAKGNNYLKFKINNQFVSVKQVVIPARPYIKPAMQRNINTIRKHILDSILKGNQ